MSPGRSAALLPEPDRLADAIVRLTLEYPRDWETQIDDAALHEYCSQAFEFHLLKRPQMEGRIRLPEDHSIGSLTPLELLDRYWQSGHVASEDSAELNKLAAEVMQDEPGSSPVEGA